MTVREKPKVFAVPLGKDFCVSLLSGVKQRLSCPAIGMARVSLYVNTRRLERRLTDLLIEGSAILHPKLSLLSDIKDSNYPQLSASEFERILILLPQVRQLLKAVPNLAPGFTAIDFAASLSKIFEEFSGEGIDPASVLGLDVTDQSKHWDLSKQFLEILFRFVAVDELGDPEKIRRRATLNFVSGIAQNGLANPLVIAGSTGSRATTFDLMQQVAQTDNGYVVLPGFDFDIPQHIFDRIARSDGLQDHPQYRFAKLLSELDLSVSDVETWCSNDTGSNARNRLVSLALCPAPVTDQWIEQGPKLTQLDQAFENVTWLEAKDQRQEAEVIALGIRANIDQGLTTAMVTPDRNLTRKISAALTRWNIVADDSAGVPLNLSAPGRFVNLLTQHLSDTFDWINLFSLLNHPLTNTGNRGQHLLASRELELFLRQSYDTPTFAKIKQDWCKSDPQRNAWFDWMYEVANLDVPDSMPVADWAKFFMTRAEKVSVGPDSSSLELWDKDAGRSVLTILQDFAGSANDTPLAKDDFARLLSQAFNGAEARSFENVHPMVKILGTLEARVQSADVVILASLNEGVWPENPENDHWLSRDMRKQLGLLLPDRKIGLAAHDFQQAVCSETVWVTRATRSDDTQTVPSRWLNRIEILLDGIGEAGTSALRQAKARGTNWVNQNSKLNAFPKISASVRPAPVPPIHARPRKLSITEIQPLIRNPYSIYAKHILDLRPLGDLFDGPDARHFGTFAHKVLELFVRNSDRGINEIADEIANDSLDDDFTRLVWASKIRRFSDAFESFHSALEPAKDRKLEKKAEFHIEEIDFTLTGTADRIDIFKNHAWIVDYKTGEPPSKKAQAHFDKQLLLEIELLRKGAFQDVGAFEHVSASYLKLSQPIKRMDASDGAEDFWSGFVDLVSNYLNSDSGFTARRAAEKLEVSDDYDHLSRWGEWELSDHATKIDLS